MFAKLVQWVFMDKHGRAAARKLRQSGARKTATQRPSGKKSAAPKAPPAPAETPDAEASPPSEREKLIAQTMALYRERREEYEQLDESVREKLSKIAGDKLGEKDC